MNIDNITSEDMTLTNNGKAMLIKVYEEEIERLKDLCNKYEEEHKTTYEIWKKDIYLYNSMVDRIDKAIEYIYLHSTQRKWFADISDRLHNQEIQFKGRIEDLLNILKGSDKE